MNSKCSHLIGGGKNIFAKSPSEIYCGYSLQAFRKFCQKHKDKLLIGALSYDLAYDIHGIKKTAKDDLKLPKIYFQAYKDWEISKPSPKYESNENDTKELSENFKPKITKAEYKKAFNKIKNYIKEGDIYQINLTHRLHARTSLQPKEIFKRVLEKNPAEFAAMIEAENFSLLSASPERFIKIKNNIIETCPVKGTRPRGETAKRDEALKKELLESEKEAAELNMITDLMRNDLGKIAKTGTVKVQGHRLISKCPTVWHTYSRITAELKVSPIEALLSMFPGGSITGCPKKRAIEIIDELENTTRAFYTGVIGYIAPQNRHHNLPNDLDFNIAIRTIIKKGQNLYLQVGGGIVIDSTLEGEYEETLQKAAAFMKILKK